MDQKKVPLLAQKFLNKRGFNVDEDGIAGKKTYKALAKIEEIPQDWINWRKLVGAAQLAARENEIEVGEIDGFWGPQTEHALDDLEMFWDIGEAPTKWRDEEDDEEDDALDAPWPSQKKEEDLIAFYGPAGENQTNVILPYKHKLSWATDKVITRFKCHEKVKESTEKVLTQVLDHYGLEEIQRLGLDLWGGCLNVRKMRGGSRYSMHSWGIAIDFDPDRNKLKWGRDKASFAKSEYDAWWEFWEAEGWVSLGRRKNYDWMHIQAARFLFF